MARLTYVKYEKISLLSHPELNEKWIQDLIAEDPSILGLGDLILKDKERLQPRAGRLRASMSWTTTIDGVGIVSASPRGS